MFLAFFRNTIERDRWKNEITVIELADQAFFFQADIEPDSICLCHADGIIETLSFTSTTVTVSGKDYHKITLDSPFKCGRYSLMITYGENYQWSEWFDAQFFDFSADESAFEGWHLPIMVEDTATVLDLTKRNFPTFDKTFLPQWQWYAKVYAPYNKVVSGQIFLVDSDGSETYLGQSDAGDPYTQLKSDDLREVFSSFLGQDATVSEGWYRYKAFVMIMIDGDPLSTALIYSYSEWFYLGDSACDFEKNLVTITLQNNTNLGRIPYYYGSEFYFKIPAFLREIEVPKTEEGESDIDQFLVPTLQYHKNRYILQTGLIDSRTVDVLRTLPFWDSVIIESVTKTIFDLKDVEVSVEWQFDQKEFAVATINMQAELITKDILPPSYLVEFYVSNDLGVISGASISINGETLTTDVNGYASIQLIAGSYNYTVTAAGNYSVSGSVIVTADTVVYVTMIQGGLYTEEELDDMIFNQGYIPIASGAELNSIRTAGIKTMGSGTKWAGSCDVAINTTGKNKFVMVLPISLAAYQSGAGWEPIPTITATDFVFDGNELNITDFLIAGSGTTDRGLFIVVAGWLKNMRIFGGVVSGGGGIGVLVARGANMINNVLTDCELTGANIIGQMSGYAGVKSYENCHVINGTLNTTYGGDVGMFFGINGKSASTIGNAIKVESCTASGTITNSYAGTNQYENIGGFVGYTEGAITKCWANVTVNGGRARFCGGFAGQMYGTSADTQECFALGNVVSNSHAGGFCGIYVQGAKSSNCYSKGSAHITITITGVGLKRVGGFTAQLSVNNTLGNCYSTGAVSSATAPDTIGGFTSAVGSGDAVTNCYWDVETSGQATSAGGTGQFTAIMKQSPVPGAGVYDSWSPDIWDAMSNVEYPQLKNNYE